MRRIPLILGLLATPLLIAGTEEEAPAATASPTPIEPLEVDTLFALPLVAVLPAERGHALPMTPELLQALSDEHWNRAAELALGLPKSPDQAFLASWCLVKARRGAEAEVLIDRMDGPPNWVLVTQGEVLAAVGRTDEAIDALELVDLDVAVGDRAGLLRARLLEKAGRVELAKAQHLALAERVEPRVGTPESLVWLAKHYGERTPDAYPYLRRLWTEYPGGNAEAWAEVVLRRHHRTPPTDFERARRAERLMWRWHTTDALTETRAMLPKLDEGSEPWCRARYVRGRSYAMRYNHGAAVQAFGEAGAACTDNEFGERIQWWSARSEGRMRHHAHATTDYALLGALYPNSRLADDALLKAGEHSIDTGDWEAAEGYWAQALTLPEGDRTAEAGFRLAWRRYVSGDTPAALEVAAPIAAMPLERGRFDVPAARYWSARWALYPDVENPQQAAPEAREGAVERWVALCEEAPWSVYAVLAWMRLSEEAPDEAARLARRRTTLEPFAHSWLVRREFREDTRDALGLARVGLMSEAHAAWADVDEQRLRPDEYGLWTELRVANGEQVEAHADARVWLRTHPWDVHQPSQEHLAALVYPRVFGEQVDRASEGYRFEPLTLQALIRTESNFDHEVRSRMGARGLSQLMPYTARRVARWDGDTVVMKDLYDPDANLALGARYLDFLYEQFQGNPFLAAAGYNAGEHRVEYWLSTWGNVPTDEFMERIPYPETRGYVKRVVGSWQAYELLHGDGDRFQPLQPFSRQAQPEGVRELLPDPDKRP